MLNLQETRKSGLIYDLFQSRGVDGAAAFLAEQGIKMNKDTESDKWILIYNVLNCSNSNPYGQKCRGIVVDKDGCVVARKFDRFFNYGEMPAITGQVDFTRAIYQPKEDGSLIGIWYDRELNKWRITTKGTIDGKGPVKVANVTKYQLFDELVYETLVTNEYSFQLQMDIIANAFGYGARDFSFVFELCSKKNKVITDYQENKMILLNIFFNHPDEQPIPQDEFVLLADYFGKTFKNVEPVKEITGIKSKEEALEYCKTLSGLREGLVIYDPVTKIRLKMKSPRYVWVANIKGEDKEPTLSQLAEIAYCGEISEFATYFPEWRGQLETVQGVVVQKFNELNYIYQTNFANSNASDTVNDRAAMAAFASTLSKLVPNAYYQKLFFMAKRTGKDFETIFKESSVKYYVGFFEAAFKDLNIS